MDLVNVAPEVVWETSPDGVKFLRTPRDQAIVVNQDLDLYEIQLRVIRHGKSLREFTLEHSHTVGENFDWTKPYQELPPESFPSVGEMLLEREADLAVLMALNFRPKRSTVGLLFDVELTARQAAEGIYKVLWSDAKLRLPLWAHHALNDGWTPPEGWRP